MQCPRISHALEFLPQTAGWFDYLIALSPTNHNDYLRTDKPPDCCRTLALTSPGPLAFLGSSPSSCLTPSFVMQMIQLWEGLFSSFCTAVHTHTHTQALVREYMQIDNISMELEVIFNRYPMTKNTSIIIIRTECSRFTFILQSTVPSQKFNTVCHLYYLHYDSSINIICTAKIFLFLCTNTEHSYNILINSKHQYIQLQFKTPYE